ncbi:RNA-directed DNA polymerase (reverse transcriptase)-related family protein [Thalictrum thalictroides]|uniref:RNA-directed DNA polymerase (Reverse transcriptase)-related family protein n=1 Tax=Thalictrum thalictroides TaxID=46969 RepID=A0A7J6VQV9_THATH|nr:RNA-directed DNA polymerase (reverse transcriptase)-related family protein [Thalictrum thalictroides]
MTSLLAVKDVLRIFAKATGLVMNTSKTSLLWGGLGDDYSQELANALGVSLVRSSIYLGVPLTAIADCQPLIERTLQRINNWKSRQLSYAGMVELIRYVLNSFHIYWSKTFILAAKVMDTLVKKCALFLWNGHTPTNKMHQAKLSIICFEKEEGGLGLKDMRKWNVAAYMGLVFKLARKEDGLWVDWQNEARPWYCRDLVAGILKLKDRFQQFCIRHVFKKMNQIADYLAGLSEI